MRFFLLTRLAFLFLKEKRGFELRRPYGHTLYGKFSVRSEESNQKKTFQACVLTTLPSRRKKEFAFSRLKTFGKKQRAP